MKKYAVIVAGGAGSRMGKDIPKQFLNLAGRPILHYTVEIFLSAYTDLEILLVIPSPFRKWGEEIVQASADPSRVSLVSGGSTRFQSVKNGLMKIQENSVVFIHDGVRCLLTGQLIHHCYEQTILKGNAVPAVAATESVRLIKGDHNQTIDRNLVRLVQTPQTFLSTIIQKAYQCEEQDSFTDEASVVEHSGESVHLIEGEYTNIKITRPQDLAIAEQILKLQGRAPLI